MLVVAELRASLLEDALWAQFLLMRVRLLIKHILEKERGSYT